MSSLVDFVKLINMSYYNNEIGQYQLIANKDRRFIKPYFDNFRESADEMGNFSLKELVDNKTASGRSQDIADLKEIKKIESDSTKKS